MGGGTKIIQHKIINVREFHYYSLLLINNFQVPMNPTMYSRELKKSCQLLTNIAVCYPLNTRQLLNIWFNCNVYLYINWKNK